VRVRRDTRARRRTGGGTWRLAGRVRGNGEKASPAAGGVRGQAAEAATRVQRRPRTGVCARRALFRWLLCACALPDLRGLARVVSCSESDVWRRRRPSSYGLDFGPVPPDLIPSSERARGSLDADAAGRRVPLDFERVAPRGCATKTTTWSLIPEAVASDRASVHDPRSPACKLRRPNGYFLRTRIGLVENYSVLVLVRIRTLCAAVYVSSVTNVQSREDFDLTDDLYGTGAANRVRPYRLGTRPQTNRQKGPLQLNQGTR
jgi:hypothetical protein